MPRFAEVRHTQWFAAPAETVRAQFADLRHHIEARVHPELRFEILAQRAGYARYVQEVKLLGLTQRDVFERGFDDDGTMIDTVVEGANRGGSLRFCFSPRQEQGRDGTQVDVFVRLPLPPVIGRLVRPLLEAQIKRAVSVAALEDKRDIEEQGYAPSVVPMNRLKAAA